MHNFHSPTQPLGGREGCVRKKLCQIALWALNLKRAICCGAQKWKNAERKEHQHAQRSAMIKKNK